MEKTELKCGNKDRFPEEIIGLFTETANYVLSKLRFGPWRNDQELRRYYNRGLREIVESKRTHFLFPCIETAMVAASYLNGKKFPAFLKVLVEEENAKKFRGGESRVLGIDSIVEVHTDSGVYGLDIGAGDLTLLTPTGTPRIHSGTKTYLTTRHKQEERIWVRDPVLVLNVSRVGNIPPLCYLGGALPGNLVKDPFMISGNEVIRQNLVPGKPTIGKLNQQYDKEALAQYNQDFFRGLKTFDYG